MATKPLDFAALDEQESKLDQVQASQQFVTEHPPEQAAPTLDYARRAGISFEAAASAPRPKPQADWGQLVKDHPILSDELSDKGFAAVAQDDVKPLSTFEKLFGNWSDAVDFQNWQEIVARDSMHKELAIIGNAEMAGKATPEQLKRAEEIEKKMAAKPEPKYGFVAGIIPGMVGMAPALARASKGAAAGLAAGAVVGSAAGGVGAVPGGLAGMGMGFTMGMSMDTAETEQGIAFREYRRLGADEKTAATAAAIVAFANGSLAGVPAEKVLNLAPPLKALLAGKGTRDLMRKIVGSNTGRAALARFGARVGESGIVMALVNNGMELVKELGQLGATGSLPADMAERHKEATRSGLQIGLGFGVVHAVPNYAADMAEVRKAENRVELYKAIGQISTDSKLRERMPEEFKRYANRVIGENGGPVQEAKAPAEKLVDLFQKEGISSEDVAKSMPEVARQLEEAKLSGDMKREVVVPMGDLATHIAPMKSFTELHPDLRIGDELTPREAKEVEKNVEAALSAKKPEGEPEGESTRKVYEDVYKQLVEKAGRAPDNAAKEAVLWSYFATSRGKRLGVDPWDYYKNRNIEIGSDFTAPEGATELTQPTNRVVISPGEYEGASTLTYPGSPINLSVYEGMARGEKTLFVNNLALGAKETEANRRKFGGQGYSTALYLRALRMAQEKGLGFSSGWPRTDATERMYSRLRGLDIPFEKDDYAAHDDPLDLSTYYIEAADLKKIDLDKAEKLNEANAEIKTLHQLDEYGNPEPNWYSAVARSVEQAKQDKGDAKSWLAVISKTPGVKKEEIDYLGLESWLKDVAAAKGNPEKLSELGLPPEFKGTLIREQVAKFVADHEVRVEETILGGMRGLDESQREELISTLNENQISVGYDHRGRPEFEYQGTDLVDSTDLEDILNHLYGNTGEITREQKSRAEQLAHVISELEYDDSEETLKAAREALDYTNRKIADISNFDLFKKKGPASEDEKADFGYLTQKKKEMEESPHQAAVDAINEAAKELEELGIHVEVDENARTVEYQGQIDEDVTLTDPEEIVNHIRETQGRREGDAVAEAIDQLKNAEEGEGGGTEYRDYTLKRGKFADEGSYRELLMYAPKIIKGYSSPHWSNTGHEKNLMMHVRFSDHTINGENVLFVEEIQSDLHQAARDVQQKARDEIRAIDRKIKSMNEGIVEIEQQATEDARGLDYAMRGSRIEDAKKEIARLETKKKYLKESNGYDSMDALKNRLVIREKDKSSAGKRTFVAEDPATGRRIEREFNDYADTKERAAKILWREMTDAEEVVPDAPFKQTWEEVGLKRILSWAAEKGYEKIAWTTGEIQADRYSNALQEQVGRVTYKDGHLRGFNTYNGGEVLHKEVPENQLHRYVGREMAQRLITSGEVSGDNIKIGGEGMRLAYDEKLPSMVEKYVKKHGGTVQQEAHPALTKVKTRAAPEAGMDVKAWAAEVARRADERKAILREWIEELEKHPNLAIENGEIPNDPSLHEKFGKHEAVISMNEARVQLNNLRRAQGMAEDIINGKIKEGEELSAMLDDDSYRKALNVFRTNTGLYLGDITTGLETKTETPVWTATIPESLREQLQAGVPLFQKGAAEGSYRGKISFDEARSWMRITLSGKANLSTFLHESGHAFLEFMRKDAESGHEQSKADWEIINKYLRADGQLDERHLELWARSFEAYLREGRAPSPGLVEAFRSFAAWLKYVYKNLTGLGVELTDEVRGVMDRMLATDEEIDRSRRGLGLDPMDTAGMDEAAAKKYTEMYTKVMLDAKDAADRQTLRNFGRAVKGEHERTRAQVDEMVKNDPEYNTIESIRTGKRLDGSSADEAVAGKMLDRSATHELLGENPLLKQKMRTLTAAEGGVDPDIAAPFYGYKSGSEMVQALASKQNRGSFTRDEVNRRMSEKYPGYDGSRDWAAAATVKALHEDGVTNLLWAEAQAASKAAGKEAPRTALAQAKLMAKRSAGQMTQVEMQPGRFARAEGTAGREWAEAWKAKDFASAHDAKMRQILNHELWKAVSDAKEEFDGHTEYLRKFEELPAQRRLMRSGPQYAEAVDAILRDIELTPKTNKDLTRRASLESFLKEIEAEGGTVSIPEELRSELGFKNVRQMTLDDLRTVVDAVSNIEAQSRLKNKLFDGRMKRNFVQTATKLSEHVKANLGNRYGEKLGDKQNPEWWEAKKEWLRKGVAELKKIEFLTREMDGGETAGLAHELIFQPFATAEEKKNRMYNKVIGDLMKPMKELTLKERIRYDRMVDFLGTPMRLRDVLAIPLNLGNEGNRRKLLDGYAYRGWTEEKVLARLGELLNDKDLDLVEHITKTVNSLWPEIKALSERTVGIAPPKVEALAFTINGRKIEGGYYPIVYDRRKGYKAEQISQRKTGDLFENNFLLPATSKGFTEARTKFSAPVELSLGIVPDHINEVVHYLTHYEPVRAVDRLLNNKLVRGAITEGQGRETYNLFRPWLQSIAADGTIHEGTTVLDGIFRHLRVGATLTALGGKVSTALMQALNFTSTMKEIGPLYTAKGALKFMKEIELSFDPFKDVNERSPQVRDFEKQMSRELLNDFHNTLSLYADLGHMKDRVAHFSMSMMGLVQKTVNAITWYGAFEKASAENHPRPAEYADSAVRLSQMGEGIKDKSAIQRGGELTKTFTMMYSYFNVVFNQISERQGNDKTAWQKVSTKAATWWWIVTLPVALDMLLGRGMKKVKDDPEEWMKHFATEQARFASRGIPGFSMAVDTLVEDGDPRYAPWMTTMLRSIRARSKMVQGENLSKRDEKDIVDSIGIASHLPTTAARNAYRFLDAYQNGNLEEPVQDLLFRSPGDFK